MAASQSLDAGLRRCVVLYPLVCGLVMLFVVYVWHEVFKP